MDSQEEVTPIIALTVLSQLFNVDLNPKKDQQTEGMCERVLSYVEIKQRVPVQRLWHFIECIMGFLEESSSDFNHHQLTEIRKLFGYFYRQRLTKVPKASE